MSGDGERAANNNNIIKQKLKRKSVYFDSAEISGFTEAEKKANANAWP